MTSTATIIGNCTKVPELKFSAAGKAVLKISVAVNRRQQVNGEWQDGPTSFFDITCFGKLAENTAASIGKGTRVIAVGRLEQRTWETADGQKRSSVELVADDIAVSLARNTVELHEVSRDLAPARTVDLPDEEPF